jgi:hypothetical protein
MNEAREQPPGDRVPVLTEVLGVESTAPPPALAPIDEKRLVDDIMAALQQRVDLSFEYRLREAVAPVLDKMAQTIIEDTRQALAATLRDVVARAVAQELARRQRR